MTEEDTLELVDEVIEPLTIITKYEYARLVGYRADQLNKGMLPALPYEEYKDLIHDTVLIAKREVDRRVCPVGVRRKYVDGTEKLIVVTEGVLILDH